jgi:Icc-related predicted phosphoesterase
MDVFLIMRLQVLSDLHLEFGQFEPTLKNADVVVLAGDIHVGTAGVKWAKQYFRDCPVIYVPGNHEFYYHSIPDLIHALKREANGSNVHVLDNEAFMLDGFVFLGCTLWTNFKFWPDAREAMSFANQEMSDFRLIQKPPGNKLFSAKDSAKIHAASVRWLARQMSRHDPARTIVVTHHAPSPWSIPPYHVSDMLSAAFASDLNSLIKASGIPLWIHGHTHYNVDYKIGTTRIYSNQRGYPNEVKKCFEPGDIIKVL